MATQKRIALSIGHQFTSIFTAFAGHVTVSTTIPTSTLWRGSGKFLRVSNDSTDIWVQTFNWVAQRSLFTGFSQLEFLLTFEQLEDSDVYAIT